MSLRQQVDSLIDHIMNGKILEAMDTFYADDIVMQENRNPPTEGKAANTEREKQFLAMVKEWQQTNIAAVATEGTPDEGVSFMEYSFDFISTEDKPVHYEQVSVQRWKDGKIIHERFYYDTGA